MLGLILPAYCELNDVIIAAVHQKLIMADNIQEGSFFIQEKL